MPSLGSIKILFVSAYQTDQQTYWLNRLTEYWPDAEWTHVTLPPDNYSWRVRGSSLNFIHEFPEELAGDYDLLLTTNIVDLSTLRGLVPSLARVPSIVYFHDNPFAYPDSSRPGSSLDAQLTCLYTAHVADLCLFNSMHNKSSFLSGAAAYLEKYAGEVPAGLIQKLLRKSDVLPIPLAEDIFEWSQSARPQNDTLRILWSHRWGFDKGPERLLSFAKALDASDVDAKLVITGAQGRTPPSSMVELIRKYSHVIAYCECESNRERLAARMLQCDVALSTARHDFQGIAVMEAAVMGCAPLLPDRLAYPEYFSEQPRYRSSPDADTEAASAVALLRTWRDQGMPAQPKLDHLRSAELKPAYDQAFAAVMGYLETRAS